MIEYKQVDTYYVNGKDLAFHGFNPRIGEYLQINSALMMDPFHEEKPLPDRMWPEYRDAVADLIQKYPNAKITFFYKI